MLSHYWKILKYEYNATSILIKNWKKNIKNLHYKYCWATIKKTNKENKQSGYSKLQKASRSIMLGTWLLLLGDWFGIPSKTCL